MNPGCPTAPGALPLLGHALPLLRDPLAFLSSLPAHGDLVRVRLGPRSLVVVCDPDLTRQVLLNDRTFDKGGPLYDRMREVIGEGLATCPHSGHRARRRLCQSAFRTERLAAYGSLFAASTESMAESWTAGQVVDVLPEMTALAMRGTVKALFGTGLPPSVETAVVDDTATIVRGVLARTVTPAVLTRLPTPGNRRYFEARARLHRTVSGVITAHRAAGQTRTDLLSALLDAAAATAPGDSRMLGDAELTDETLTFLLGGTETTASALTWALHLLGTHPAVEERLHAEVDRVVGHGPVRAEHAPLLQEAGRIVTEVLRLYPPAWLLSRTVTEDTQLGGTRLAAGTTLVYSPYLIHRRPDVYPDAERFDPDRWRTADPRHSAFFPFGAGARKCIGDRFALTETVLALAAVASRWKLVPAGDRPVGVRVHAALSPRGVRMRVDARAPLFGGSGEPPTREAPGCFSDRPQESEVR